MLSNATVSYTISAADLHAHLWQIEIEITHPQAQALVGLPTWIPGSYLIREFAQHLQGLQAFQQGQALTLKKINKSQWRIDCSNKAPLTLRYYIYGLDDSVRGAWLNDERGFFNPACLCLHVFSQMQAPHRLMLEASSFPPDWKVATGLPALNIDAKGWGLYQACDYGELIDSPFTLGPFIALDFVARQTPHRLLITGAPANLDGARLQADIQTLVEAQLAFWHPDPQTPPPYAHYVFMLNINAQGYGGLEHRNSTALIASVQDLPTLGFQHKSAPALPLKAQDPYIKLLGLISHEFFHTWNVKRLKPIEFATYDLHQENYTSLLWFFEGFTSYFDTRFLVTTGLIDIAIYLELLTQTLRSVSQCPSQSVHSVKEASFDAWIQYYRPSHNSPNISTNYYSKGALIALCLDAALRQHGSSLDEFMRDLYAFTQAGPMSQQDLFDCLAQKQHSSLIAPLQEWITSKTPLPLKESLKSLGLNLISQENPSLETFLGLKIKPHSSLTIQYVLRHSPAEKWGLQTQDKITAVTVEHQQWKVTQLADIYNRLTPSGEFILHIVREQRIIALQLTWPEAFYLPDLISHLHIEELSLLHAWLNKK